MPPSPIAIDGTTIEQTVTSKLLGFILSKDLSWGLHVEHLHGNCSRSLYLLTDSLKRAGVANQDVLRIYFAMIVAMLEYACPVWHSSLTKAQVDRMESVQRMALQILYPDRSYMPSLRSPFEYPPFTSGGKSCAGLSLLVWWIPVTDCTTCCLKGQLWCEHWENRNHTQWSDAVVSGSRTRLSHMNCHTGSRLGWVAHCLLLHLDVVPLGSGHSPFSTFFFQSLFILM